MYTLIKKIDREYNLLITFYYLLASTTCGMHIYKYLIMRDKETTFQPLYQYSFTLYIIWAIFYSFYPLLTMIGFTYLCDTIRRNAIYYREIFEEKLIESCNKHDTILFKECKYLLCKEMHLTFFGLKSISFATITSLMIVCASNIKILEFVYNYLKNLFNLELNEN